MNIRRHMKHTIQWRQALGGDQWNTESYGVPVDIRARVEEKGRTGSAATLTEENATTNILVEEDVLLGDQVNVSGEWETVQTREEIVDIRGKRLGWKLYLDPVQRS